MHYTGLSYEICKTRTPRTYAHFILDNGDMSTLLSDKLNTHLGLTTQCAIKLCGIIMRNKR